MSNASHVILMDITNPLSNHAAIVTKISMSIKSIKIATYVIVQMHGISLPSIIRFKVYIHSKENMLKQTANNATLIISIRVLIKIANRVMRIFTKEQKAQNVLSVIRLRVGKVIKQLITTLVLSV